MHECRHAFVPTRIEMRTRTCIQSTEMRMQRLNSRAHTRTCTHACAWMLRRHAYIHWYSNNLLASLTNIAECTPLAPYPSPLFRHCSNATVSYAVRELIYAATSHPPPPPPRATRSWKWQSRTAALTCSLKWPTSRLCATCAPCSRYRRSPLSVKQCTLLSLSLSSSTLPSGPPHNTVRLARTAKQDARADSAVGHGL